MACSWPAFEILQRRLFIRVRRSSPHSPLRAALDARPEARWISFADSYARWTRAPLHDEWRRLVETLSADHQGCDQHRVLSIRKIEGVDRSQEPECTSCNAFGRWHILRRSFKNPQARIGQTVRQQALPIS